MASEKLTRSHAATRRGEWRSMWCACRHVPSARISRAFRGSATSEPSWCTVRAVPFATSSRAWRRGQVEQQWPVALVEGELDLTQLRLEAHARTTCSWQGTADERHRRDRLLGLDGMLQDEHARLGGDWHRRERHTRTTVGPKHRHRPPAPRAHGCACCGPLRTPVRAARSARGRSRAAWRTAAVRAYTSCAKRNMQLGTTEQQRAHANTAPVCRGRCVTVDYLSAHMYQPRYSPSHRGVERDTYVSYGGPARAAGPVRRGSAVAPRATVPCRPRATVPCSHVHRKSYCYY